MSADNVFLQEPEAQKPEVNFAVIGTIYSDGVTLIFDGEDDESVKHYKVNSFVVFAAGDRVRIVKDSGTYVVEYPVGNPKTSFTAENSLKLGGKAASALSVNYATSSGSATSANSATSASSATSADKASGVINQSNINNVLQFRCSSTTQMQVKYGSTWYTVTFG